MNWGDRNHPVSVHSLLNWKLTKSPFILHCVLERTCNFELNIPILHSLIKMKNFIRQRGRNFTKRKKSKGTEESQSQYQDTDEGNKITKKKRGGK